VHPPVSYVNRRLRSVPKWTSVRQSCVPDERMQQLKRQPCCGVVTLVVQAGEEQNLIRPQFRLSTELATEELIF
jgi:hypothetical protein